MVRRSVSARAFQLGFSVASICVATIALVVVLDASIVEGDELNLDLSRGRYVAFVLSIAFLVASVFILWRSLKSPRLAIEAVPERAERHAAAEEVADEFSGEDAVFEEAAAEEDAVRLEALSKDEVELYEMIADAGGELLQMNIVASGVFSKAKVTRLLDKLESKGLVVRERHGMTNRVRILR